MSEPRSTEWQKRSFGVNPTQCAWGGALPILVGAGALVLADDRRLGQAGGERIERDGSGRIVCDGEQVAAMVERDMAGIVTAARQIGEDATVAIGGDQPPGRRFADQIAHRPAADAERDVLERGVGGADAPAATARGQLVEPLPARPGIGAGDQIHPAPLGAGGDGGERGGGGHAGQERASGGHPDAMPVAGRARNQAAANTPQAMRPPELPDGSVL